MGLFLKRVLSVLDGFISILIQVRSVAWDCISPLILSSVGDDGKLRARLMLTLWGGFVDRVSSTPQSMTA